MVIARKLVALLASVLVSACAAVQPAEKVSIDYNRAFAKSRNEVLLLNILRAAERQPLQFSTMGTVTGSVRGSSTLSLPLTNLIGGKDPFSISPTFGLNEANPTMSVIPLSDKEFTQGMLSPITPEVLGYFINQGWDPEFILPLVVEGVRCPRSGVTVLNRGDFTTPSYYKFARMFAEAGGGSFQIEQSRIDGNPTVTLRMAAKEALEFVKGGVGDNRRIVSLKAAGDKADLEIAPVQTVWFGKGLNPGYVCEAGDENQAVAALSKRDTSQRYSAALSGMLLSRMSEDSPLKLRERASGVLLLRSVESIIYFLGEGQRIQTERQLHACRGDALENRGDPGVLTYRRSEQAAGASNPENILFRAVVACAEDAVPLHSAVRTSLSGHNFYIPLLKGQADPDRSLKTLSFLSELIALQTSQALIQSATPTIAVTR